MDRTARPNWIKSQGRRFRRSCGFTYIGLLLLVAMMGLALTVVSDVWQTAQQRDKEEQLLFVGNQMRSAIGRYFAANGRYPQKLEDLLKDPRFPGVRRFLRRIDPDPITGKDEWGLLKLSGDMIAGVYSLSEHEPLKKAGFRLADQGFEGKMKYSEWVFFPKVGPAGGFGGGSAAPGAAAVGMPSDPSLPSQQQPQPGTTLPQFGTQQQGGSPRR